MTSDSPTPQDAVAAADALANDAVEPVRAAATEATTDVEGVTAAVADTAEAANREGAEFAAKASHTTADALGEARERLNAMAASLPASAQAGLNAGGAAFGKGLEAGYATTLAGMAEFNSKAIAAWRSNAESTIRHWQNLASVKSLSEAISLSAEHTRQQLEAVTTQTRELSTLATRIVRGATDPLKLTGR